MVGIGFAAGFAGGLEKLTDRLERTQEKKQQLEYQYHTLDLQHQSEQRRLAFQKAAFDQELMKTGQVSDYDQNKKLVVRPLNAMEISNMEHASQMAMKEQARQTKIQEELMAPVTAQRAKEFEDYLRAQKVREPVTVKMPFDMGAVTKTVERPAYSDEEAKSLSKIAARYGPNALGGSQRQDIAETKASFKAASDEQRNAFDKEKYQYQEEGKNDRAELYRKLRYYEIGQQMDREILRLNTSTKEIDDRDILSLSKSITEEDVFVAKSMRDIENRQRAAAGLTPLPPIKDSTDVVRSRLQGLKESGLINSYGAKGTASKQAPSDGKETPQKAPGTMPSLEELKAKNKKKE